MSKIYLITQGEYSDYRVCGAFSTEDKANQALPFYTGAPEIEEYELDQVTPKPGWWMWQVVLDENGDRSALGHAPHKIDPCPESSQYWPGLNCRAFYVCAKDENHAFKIANERRAQIVALGLWKSRCKDQ